MHPCVPGSETQGSGTHLSEVLVDAPEVGGALAVVVHDVAAQLPDGPLELVAVELELREPAADAVERVQQRVGLLPHALLDGRHDGVLGVEAAVLLLLQQRLRVDADERPPRPLVLRNQPTKPSSRSRMPGKKNRNHEAAGRGGQREPERARRTSRRRGWSKEQRASGGRPKAPETEAAAGRPGEAMRGVG